MEHIKYSYADLLNDISNLTQQLHAELGSHVVNSLPGVYGIPNGGNVPAACLANSLGLTVLAEPVKGCIIIDDIVDSGQTIMSTLSELPLPSSYKTVCLHQHERSKLFAAFYASKIRIGADFWIDYFWEKSGTGGIEENVTRIIQYIGDDPTRPGVLETPARVVKSWKELFSGYNDSAEKHLSKVFDSKADEMVILKDIVFNSYCEHHMLPFSGVAHIGYIPDGKVVGLSKLARTVDVYAKRLQIQEGLTEQIVDAMIEHIPKVKGAAVVLEGRHSCMSCRGVNKQGASMVTSALRGVFKDPTVRAEFMGFIKG